MSYAPRRSGLLAILVECKGCPWSCESRNGAGLAAQHAARTGHEVHVEQTTVTIYNGK